MDGDAEGTALDVLLRLPNTGRVLCRERLVRLRPAKVYRLGAAGTHDESQSSEGGGVMGCGCGCNSCEGGGGVGLGIVNPLVGWSGGVRGLGASPWVWVDDSQYKGQTTPHGQFIKSLGEIPPPPTRLPLPAQTAMSAEGRIHSRANAYGRDNAVGGTVAEAAEEIRMRKAAGWVNRAKDGLGDVGDFLPGTTIDNPLSNEDWWHADTGGGSQNASDILNSVGGVLNTAGGILYKFFGPSQLPPNYYSYTDPRTGAQVVSTAGAPPNVSANLGVGGSLGGIVPLLLIGGLVLLVTRR